MKRIFFLAFAVIFSLGCFAQEIDVNEVNFYGVDFSKAKIFGSSESPDEIKKGLSAISVLMSVEYKKYNFDKFLKKTVFADYFESTNKNNSDLDAEKMYLENTGYRLSDVDINAVINSLSSESKDKIGVVFIAEMLNKSKRTASYNVVFFNEADKKIIYQKTATGRAGGLGIRNFWANSIFDLMKRWRY